MLLLFIVVVTTTDETQIARVNKKLDKYCPKLKISLSLDKYCPEWSQN